MTKFKRVDTSNGRIMYYVDGVLTSKSAMEASALSILTEPMEIELETSSDEQTDNDKPNGDTNLKVCLFDDTEATHQKYLNEVTIGLCDVHYSLTTGKIAQLLREITKGKA